MAFIPVPKTVEVSIVFQNDAGRDSRITMNITGPVVWTITAMDALATSLIDVIFSDGLGWLSDHMSIQNLHLTSLESDSAPSIDAILGTGTNILPKVGGQTGDLAPLQAALVTTLRTPNRGRSFRGRVYLPGLSDGQVNSDGETITSARVAAQQAFITSLQTAANAFVSPGLVVVSRHSGGVPRTTGITTPVTGLDTNNQVDTQRRRVKP